MLSFSAPSILTFYFTRAFTIKYLLRKRFLSFVTFIVLTHLTNAILDIDAPGGGFFVSLRKFMAFFLLVSVLVSIMDDKTGAAGAAISSRLGMSSTVRQAEERYNTSNSGCVIFRCTLCLLHGFVPYDVKDFSSRFLRYVDEIDTNALLNFLLIVSAAVTRASMMWWALTRPRQNLRRLYSI